MIIAANISLQLTNLGYKVIGTIPRSEEVLPFIKQQLPDIILLDINLKGDLDGIQIAHLINKEYKIPIIFLTANADEVHFNNAKATNPYAFIAKPFKKLDLQRAIELTINRIKKEKEAEKITNFDTETPFLLSDCIFVRSHEKMVKVFINDILGKELHLISFMKEPVTINKAVHFALTTSNFDAFVKTNYLF